MTQPTLEELLACLGEQQGPAEGYRTAAEWADALKISPRRLRVLMLAARAQGRLLLRHEAREALDGRQARVPVYRFALDA